MFRAEKTMFRLQATSARLLGFLGKIMYEYSRGYKNILKAQTSTYNQSLAIEIQNRTIWTNKKANQSNMKDIHNTTINETCDKCGETEDTNHLFLECEMYAEKIWQILQQLIIQAQRRLHVREIAKKNNPNINDEDIRR